ncbi:hypothetical protein FP74_gp082 [Bacillus phage CAM003]|uniref:Uncharacterized protein n=3 Tax=Bastillevirus TaxID=1918010 RepID=A0A024B1Y2_9CAUD|nr:hypothetical protein FP73_gp081 [Bacillus phage Hoody T]YP_009035805.1 hypothetical protein FP76_gp086 [Bacillus phage Evoli]YP_009037180.1 hypothetical protein FP74_gp082 [Bacillus phage CAM003]AHZ09714.1 hypothetical protein [Bacillus phage CAM003]AHZ10008.1 hypothetical protein [Bacillus phage Evoli]AHZ10572.1 hypothetical protein [Bacillus phage Hoody T]
MKTKEDWLTETIEKIYRFMDLGMIEEAIEYSLSQACTPQYIIVEAMAVVHHELYEQQVLEELSLERELKNN